MKVDETRCTFSLTTVSGPVLLQTGRSVEAPTLIKPLQPLHVPYSPWNFKVPCAPRLENAIWIKR